jgi:hypothetical protein
LIDGLILLKLLDKLDLKCYIGFKFLVRIVPDKITAVTAGVENLAAGPETATVQATHVPAGELPVDPASHERSADLLRRRHIFEFLPMAALRDVFGVPGQVHGLPDT